MVIPSSALGLDGATPPSERVRVAGIGIGRRGEYDLGCFLQQPDVQFVAICDVKEARRQAVKAIAAKIPAIFLGTRVDTGVVGKNVMAPIVTGRGGFGRIDKWQVR
jgi:hypothetical protein